LARNFNIYHERKDGQVRLQREDAEQVLFFRKPSRFAASYSYKFTNQDFTMKLILAVPAVSLLFTGAVSLNRLSPYAAFLPTPEKPALTAAPKMWAQTAAVYKGEKFDLSFETPHPVYLGAIDPNGKFFYVVFPTEPGQGKLTPLVDGTQFARQKSLTIHTATLKADPYIYGILENQPVFTKSGTYSFVLGDKLHTDDQSSVSIVKVVYHDTKRPSAPTSPTIAAN